MRRWIRCPHGTMGRRKMRFRSETASLSLSPPDCDTCDIGGMPRRFAGHSSCADGSVALMERWAGEKCDSGVRACDYGTIKSEVCEAGRSHCDIRSGWNCMGFPPDVHTSDLLLGSSTGSRCQKAGVE